MIAASSRESERPLERIRRLIREGIASGAWDVRGITAAYVDLGLAEAPARSFVQALARKAASIDTSAATSTRLLESARAAIASHPEASTEGMEALCEARVLEDPIRRANLVGRRIKKNSRSHAVRIGQTPKKHPPQAPHQG